MSDKWKHLLTFGIIILAVACAFFLYAFKEHETTLVREQAFEKQQDVNLLCGIVDT